MSRWPRDRVKRVCSVADCQRPHSVRGWCAMHYIRWQRTGDPVGLRIPGLRPRSPLIRVLEATENIYGCWLWTGPQVNGYGVTIVGSTRDDSRRHARTHRVVYEALVGPVPAGLDLDHLCRNRACCNPAHLEPVTRSENLRRAVRGAA